VAARFSGAGGIAPDPDPAAAAFAFDARTGAEPFPLGGNHDEPLARGERGHLGRDAPLVGRPQTRKTPSRKRKKARTSR